MCVCVYVCVRVCAWARQQTATFGDPVAFSLKINKIHNPRANNKGERGSSFLSGNMKVFLLLLLLLLFTGIVVAVGIVLLLRPGINGLRYLNTLKAHCSAK